MSTQFSTKLTVTKYSDRSVVVRGDVETYSNELREMGGFWNANLYGGGGYVFSNARHGKKVRAFVVSMNDREDDVSDDEADSLTVEDYSERSVVVRGDVDTYAKELREMGGFWNANLKGGGGYVFSNARHGKKVREFVDSVNDCEDDVSEDESDDERNDASEDESDDEDETLTVEDYSERSVVVRGDVETHAKELREMGGFWNANLKGGGGYVFSKEKYG